MSVGCVRAGCEREKDCMRGCDNADNANADFGFAGAAVAAAVSVFGRYEIRRSVFECTVSIETGTAMQSSGSDWSDQRQ